MSSKSPKHGMCGWPSLHARRARRTPEWWHSPTDLRVPLAANLHATRTETSSEPVVVRRAYSSSPDRRACRRSSLGQFRRSRCGVAPVLVAVRFSRRGVACVIVKLTGKLTGKRSRRRIGYRSLPLLPSPRILGRHLRHVRFRQLSKSKLCDDYIII